MEESHQRGGDFEAAGPLSPPDLTEPAPAAAAPAPQISLATVMDLVGSRELPVPLPTSFFTVEGYRPTRYADGSWRARGCNMASSNLFPRREFICCLSPGATEWQSIEYNDDWGYTKKINTSNPSILFYDLDDNALDENVFHAVGVVSLLQDMCTRTHYTIVKIWSMYGDLDSALYAELSGKRYEKKGTVLTQFSIDKKCWEYKRWTPEEDTAAAPLSAAAPASTHSFL